MLTSIILFILFVKCKKLFMYLGIGKKPKRCKLFLGVPLSSEQLKVLLEITIGTLRPSASIYLHTNDKSFHIISDEKFSILSRNDTICSINLESGDEEKNEYDEFIIEGSYFILSKNAMKNEEFFNTFVQAFTKKLALSVLYGVIFKSDDEIESEGAWLFMRLFMINYYLNGLLIVIS